MDNKYYTPDIEEVCVGFEFEYNVPHSEETRWYKITYKPTPELTPTRIHNLPIVEGQAFLRKQSLLDYLDFTLKHNPRFIRVKYLDKEDIESLGFTYVDYNWGFARQNVGTSLNYIMSIGNKYYFLRTWSDGVIRISKHNVKEVENSYRLFEGIIKNKSELKRVLKQVGIDG